jgi:hypothetical protein
MLARMPAQWLRRAGLVGVLAGVTGALVAALMLAWPPAVPRAQLTYPFTLTGFVTAQVLFFVHHIGLVIGVWAFAASGAAGEHRVARGGAWLAVAGMVALTIAELNTIRFADWTTDAANKSSMGAVYGVACNAIGLGLVISGVGAIRARVWSGWRRWVPLAIGVLTFVELTPGMFGGYVIARLAIGFWILTFAALGQSLRVESAGRVEGR